MKQKNILTVLTLVVVSLLLFTSITAYSYSNNLTDQHKLDEKNDVNSLPKNADWYYKPESYDQLVGWYQDLEANFSNFIEVFKANEMYGTGQATGGYDLYYVRITNESTGFHKPEVLFLGGPHGDETVGTIGMYWFLDWFTRKAFTDEPCEEYSKEWLNWLVDNREIYFEVSHNPYGFDHGPQRYDGNGWDLNREADYDGPGDNTGGIWASENGQTLYRFINNHTIRTGCDIHGGTRMLIYPWASTYHDVVGTSPISGESYDGAPPDFYFYDAAGLRVGSFMGDGGGDGMLDESNVGTIDELIWYAVYGGIAPWAYAADVEANPQEDEYVEDETFGNYPGAGIMWYSPEMSYTKNPSESTFGNDTTDGWGWEMRRFILHQTDIAQPYVRWIGDTVDNHVTVEAGEPIPLRWQVNGSMVVDHTSVQYGSDPDPVNNYDFMTGDYDEYAGDYVGGTGWENAMDGSTDGVVYMENISISEPGEYYFVAKAQVDQVYGDVLEPGEYGDDPYLRLIKERTNDSYYESLVGTDGLEEIVGQTWWYSPVIHVTVVNPPDHDILVSNLDVPDVITHNQGVNVSATISNEGLNNETNIDVNFKVNGSIINSTILSKLNITESIAVTFPWDPAIGSYNVTIETTPIPNENDTTNNLQSKIVNVIAAPDIWVNPSIIDLFNAEGLVLNSNITIGNENYADESLHYTTSITNTDGYNWLSINISSGTLLPGEQQIIGITANTTDLPIGSYSELILIDSDDPDESTITVPVNLDIVYAHDMATTAINNPTGTIGTGIHAVNATVENLGSYDQQNVLVNCSIYEGGIGGTIIDEDFSSEPTDWTITDTSGTAWTWASTEERMENSYSGGPNAGYLDSPVLDCSGKQGITLSFWHDWKADYTSGDQDGWVRGSVDGGNTFPYLIDEFHHNDPPQESGVKTYDLSWANNQDQVMLRFEVYNDNDWHWYIDDVNMSANITGPLVYSSEKTINLSSYHTETVTFLPPWNAVGGIYGIQVATLLSGDQNTNNDVHNEVVSVEGPNLAMNPTSYDASMTPNSTDTTSFDIWNSGQDVLTYTLTESCGWLDLSSYEGNSTGEHDTIIVDINTTGLTPGQLYSCDVNISSNGGTDTFPIEVLIVDSGSWEVNQTVFDRGFPIRHAIDGDWAGAQNFTVQGNIISHVEMYVRVFGTPSFNLTVELRENNPEGTLLDFVTFPSGDIPTSWTWLTVDFDDVSVSSGTDYFIVIPPAPSGVTNSFGYEWGYAFDNQYDDGSFWFTRDGGNLWRDLPDMYEFTFKISGYS